MTSPTIRTIAASGIVGFIESLGFEADVILHSTEVENCDLDDPFGRLPLAVYCNLLEEASRRTNMERFGLHFGFASDIRLLGEIGNLVNCVPTVGTALRELCRNFSGLQEQSELRLRFEGGLALLEYRIRDGRIADRQQDSELTLGVLLNFLRKMLGSSFVPEEIRFEHIEPADCREYHASFGAEVSFVSERNAIIFRPNVLAARIPQADLIRGALIDSTIKNKKQVRWSNNLVGLVCDEIRIGFARGDLTLATVAHKIGMSESSLYRHLCYEGINFVDLVRGIRREFAVNLLNKEHISLGEIALLLGYSEQSAFSRAFKKWTGVTPLDYRKQCLAGLPLGLSHLI
ncbi:AraC-like transcriptional regulator QhpR [Acidiphilium iwatense]|nr:AraC family transcriptional regulator [Acidiphilium iwatense]